MKEFEKLWNAGMLSGSPSSFTPNPPVKTIALFAWKAALEWILYAGVLTDLPKDLIEEELEMSK